jgi:hypothetical protein
VVSIIQRILCNLLCRPAPVGEVTGTGEGLADADEVPAKDEPAKDQPAKRARREAARGGGPKPA